MKTQKRKVGRLMKVERLMEELRAEADMASHKEDWENARSMGPTLSHEQIYRRADNIWEEILQEIKRKERAGNTFAIKLARAIQQDQETKEEERKTYFFLDAYDEYLENFQ